MRLLRNISELLTIKYGKDITKIILKFCYNCYCENGDLLPLQRIFTRSE